MLSEDMYMLHALLASVLNEGVFELKSAMGQHIQPTNCVLSHVTNSVHGVFGIHLGSLVNSASYSVFL